MKEQIQILQKKGGVCIVVNGRLVTDEPIPWQAARDISRHIATVAKLAEEWDKAEQLIQDAAILQRAGANIGLTSNPVILAEAGKEAAHNRDLRRYMPGGIKSQAQFGRPTLTGTKPNGR